MSCTDVFGLQDFVASAVWTLMWFIASTALADNLSRLSAYMDPENVIKELMPKYCQSGMCAPGAPGSHVSIIIAVVNSADISSFSGQAIICPGFLKLIHGQVVVLFCFYY